MGTADGYVGACVQCRPGESQEGVVRCGSGEVWVRAESGPGVRGISVQLRGLLQPWNPALPCRLGVARDD